MKLFGFEIRRQQDLMPPQSFTPPISDDGGVNLVTGGFSGSYVDLEGSSKTESDLITRYRDMSLQPEIEMAVDEITNEAISVDPQNNRIIDINLDQININAKIKQIIKDEFEYCLNLLNFNNKAYEIFRQWYIDGRVYYHAIIDNANIDNGIVELRYIDPRNLRKVREIRQDKSQNLDMTQSIPNQKITEYFLFSNKGSTSKDFSTQYTLRIAKDSIVYCTSGLTDKSNQMVLSYLHKAIKPLNQLRVLEDATVIYRISRAPERRIFYIDIGNLPKMKAEQYVRDIMVKYKNKLAYDSSTGEIRDDRKFTTMLEDFWVPRREGGRGTEISTLPGASNIDQVSDLTYFKDALYNSLNIPINRTQSDSPFIFGETDNITKAEVKFFKSIQRMRVRFQGLFLSFLEKQLILKNIMTFEDWEKIKQYIKFDYTVDNFFAELKQGEILKQRINIATMIEPYIGKYYSEEFVRRNILQQSDDDIALIDSQIELDRQKALERALVQANQDSQVSLVTGRAQMQLQAEQMQMINPSEQEKSPVSAKK